MPPSSRRLKLIATLALGVTTITQAQTIPWATQIAASPDAQTLPEDRGADGLWQTLRKLHTWASVMMIVAHPDDEDGGMLTFESRGAGARVAMLTLTRGEGGQNAMSSETYDALGLLRTNELLRADQFSGTEQYWSRVADYGFSKTIDEAFEQWGHDRVLYDVVRAVRLNRPLVLTSVFTGNVTDGHGHHQVSGEMAQEAFKAAGDPNVFPDQIAAGLKPWSPLKVYARIPFSTDGVGAHKTMFDYATGKSSPLHLRDYVNNSWMDDVPSKNVEIHEGDFDPVLGRSYVQMSREGWSEQKSQNGGGNPPLPGPFDVSYHRYGSLVQTTDKEASFFDGIDVSLAGMTVLAHGDTQFLKDGLREIDRHVSRALYGYIPSDPSKIVPDLHDGYLKTKQLIDAVNASSLSADDKSNLDQELQIKLAQFNTALAESLGLQVNALVTPRLDLDRNPFFGSSADMTFLHATPGMGFNVRLHVTSAQPWTAGGKLRLARTWLVTPEDEKWPVERQGGPGTNTPSSAEADILFKVEVPNRAAPTRPYFSRPSIEQPYYNIDDQRWTNRSFAPYPVEGWAEFNYDGVPVRVGQVVQTVHWVHGLGGVYQPLVVLPRLSVHIGTGAGIIPMGSQSFPLRVTVDNEQQDAADGELHLQLPEGWTAEPATAKFHLPANDPEAVTFTVHPASLSNASYTIKAVARSGNYEFSEGVQTVGYTGMRPYYYYRPATYLARAVDVKVAPSLNIGYIMGTGDQVPEALEQIGVTPHLLTADEVLHGDLSKYDAIVLGIRTYAARPELATANRRLLDYTQSGGTVIVQYNSGEYDHNFGPYPYSLGRTEKVVDEKSKVTILESNSPLLTWPNKITAADFDGWVEERGHSFMESWDSHYSALTETHDPDQDPQKGGLLYARYGKGRYIYVAYALYRQTTEAVPGAYRIFANLISLGKNPAAK